MNTSSASSPETTIRALMQAWVEALRARDLKRLTDLYAPELIFYDLATPLSQAGPEAYREKWERMLPMFPGEIGYETRDLRIHAEGGLAFAHCLNRISDLSAGLEESAPWVRITLGFRKIAGDWKVIHEHISVPIHFPDMTAAMNLQP